MTNCELAAEALDEAPFAVGQAAGRDGRAAIANADRQCTGAAIDGASIGRSRVVFEIVETERTHDPRHRRDILDEYRGAGYSSLHLMHLLCPGVLQLEMDLRRDVDHDQCKARIAANLLDVVNALGIDALAEGIETESELEWVQPHGATFVQSFRSARPVPTPVTAIASRSPVKVAA